jgi:uncharacterized FlaG/YvyC family protein
MATATKKAPAKKAGTAHTRAGTRKPVEKSSLEYLQHAIDDLKKAREQAQHDVRSNIDSAIDRTALTELADELRHSKDKRA